MLRLAQRILGVRSGEALTRLIDELNAYYKELSLAMPADQKAAVERIARTAMGRITASVDESSGVTEGWLTGYLNKYYGDVNERLCKVCQTQVQRCIAGADGDVVGALREKLGDWGEKQAEVMARHEAAMALNKTLVAGFRQAGYSSVWRSAPGCCKMCLALNDQTITTLTPPLHKGCACTVDKGARINSDLTPEQMSAKITAEMNAFGMRGVAAVPPVQIDTSKFRFDARHVQEQGHDVSEAEARRFQREALASVTVWQGRMVKYFGRDGAVYVSLPDEIMATAFRFAQYDKHTMTLMEVLARYGLG